ncbi:hypothetical protein Purlil1_9780 [Purpureocillium lilacinum]|uniref:Uncharacterized protein n=1 Tax=Purpureocillium lilacinum TaxID=33203 RepID=A0ABR0BQ37_PURLI|nr:hypothetical protein Purlil1_9780 [Purpureocillium lilacinum]
MKSGNEGEAKTADRVRAMQKRHLCVQPVLVVVVVDSPCYTQTRTEQKPGWPSLPPHVLVSSPPLPSTSLPLPSPHTQQLRAAAAAAIAAGVVLALGPVHPPPRLNKLWVGRWLQTAHVLPPHKAGVCLFLAFVRNLSRDGLWRRFDYVMATLGMPSRAWAAYKVTVTVLGTVHSISVLPLQLRPPCPPSLGRCLHGARPPTSSASGFRNNHTQGRAPPRSKKKAWASGAASSAARAGRADSETAWARRPIEFIILPTPLTIGPITGGRSGTGKFRSWSLNKPAIHVVSSTKEATRVADTQTHPAVTASWGPWSPEALPPVVAVGYRNAAVGSGWSRDACSSKEAPTRPKGGKGHSADLLRNAEVLFPLRPTLESMSVSRCQLHARMGRLNQPSPTGNINQTHSASHGTSLQRIGQVIIISGSI